MKKKFAFYTLLFTLFLVNGVPLAHAHKLQAESNILDSANENDTAASPIPDHDDNDTMHQDNDTAPDEDGAEDDESDPMHDPDPEADIMDSGTPRAHQS